MHVLFTRCRRSAPWAAIVILATAALSAPASFSIPGFTLGAADFGVSSARPTRTVQLGARVGF